MLCDMEFCSKRVGRSKDKRLYLYGSGDNGHYVWMKLTLLAGIGTVLTLIGLFLSEYKPERNTHRKGDRCR